MINVSSLVDRLCESCDKARPCTHAVCAKGTLDAHLCAKCLFKILAMRMAAERKVASSESGA